jgi:hypothetical protein
MSLRHKIAPLNCKLEAVISSLKNVYLIQSEGNIFLSQVPIADGGGGGGGKKIWAEGATGLVVGLKRGIH